MNNTTQLLIFPETDVEITNLDLTDGSTNWTLEQFEVDNETLTKNSNLDYAWARINSASITEGANYAVRYTITGALLTTKHYAVLRGTHSVYNYGNGTFTVYICAKLLNSIYNTFAVVIKEDGTLPTDDYNNGRRIKISNLSVKEVNEYEVELYDNISIPLTFQIADIQDISKRSTSFSKTITIPGTQENNIVFKHAYVVSNDYAFKMDTPVRARLLNDTIEIFNGFLFLQNVILNNEDNTIEYNADLRSNVNSLFKVASQKYLRGNDDKIDDIDLSEWNHILNYKNVSESWWKGSILEAGKSNLPSKPTNGNDVLGQGYVYPLINYGFTNPTVTIEELAPSIFVKEVFDKIVSQAGFTYTSTFLNSDRFKRLILPKIEPVLLTEEVAERRNAKYTIAPIIWDQNYFSVLHRPNRPTTTGSHYFNLSKTEGVNDTTKYTIPNKGKYKFDINIFNKIKFGLYLQGRNVTENITVNSIQNPIGELRVSVVAIDLSGAERNLITYFIIPDSASTLNKSHILTTTPIWFKQSSGTSASVDTIVDTFNTGDDGILLEKGTRVYLKHEFVASHYNENGEYIYIITGSGQESSNVYSTFDVGAGALIMNASCIAGVPVNDGDEIDLNNLLPNKNIKQSDILTSIIKMFNLYISTDTTNLNNLIIEPRDDFYAGGEIIDWTQKRDLDSSFIIEQASDLLNKNIMFSYTEDENDYHNIKFTKDTNGLVYGQNFIKADITTTDTYEIKPIFAPTILDDFITKGNERNIIVSQIYAQDEEGKIQTAAFKMRILYWGGLQYWPLTSSSVTWRLLGSEGSTATKYYIRNNSNFYPYAGHYDNPFTKTFDLNFGQMPMYRINGSTTNNLVKLYYSRMLTELTSSASRKVTGYFYLTDEDIASFQWNNKYVIDSVYYRVNKIFDYVPNQLTKVELLKVIVEDLDINPRFTPTYSQINIISINRNNPINSIIPIPLITPPPVENVSQEEPTYEIRTSYVYPGVIANNTYNGYGIFIAPDCIANNISGDYITLEQGVVNSTITASSNITLKQGVSNVSVLNSNNLVINESNVSYINNIPYKNGIQMSRIDVLEGGEDEVQYKYSASIINKVDGGENTDRQYGSMSINNIVDGSS